MSCKKLLLIALMIGGLSTATQMEANARPHASGPKVMKMLFKDAGLSAEQKQTLKELRPDKEERQEIKKKGPERGEWMEEFASGRKSRAEVVQDLEKKLSIRQDFHQEKLEGMLDFLSTLTAEQKEQVLDNLEEMKEKKRRASQQASGEKRQVQSQIIQERQENGTDVCGDQFASFPNSED